MTKNTASGFVLLAQVCPCLSVNEAKKVLCFFQQACRPPAAPCPGRPLTVAAALPFPLPALTFQQLPTNRTRRSPCPTRCSTLPCSETPTRSSSTTPRRPLWRRRRPRCPAAPRSDRRRRPFSSTFPTVVQVSMLQNFFFLRRRQISKTAFVLGKPFRLSITFAGKVRSLPNRKSP